MTDRPRRIYLDYNATAPLLPEARAALIDALDRGGNPSSVHAEGRRARAIVEDARRKVAALVGAAPEAVVFTSGATEAAATCLSPEWIEGGSGLSLDRLAVVETDHPCLRSGGRFAPRAVTRLPVDADGRLLPDALGDWLSFAGETAPGMLALTLANSETGVLQDLANVSRALAADALVVVDAVQALGRLPLDINELGYDALILSGHKIGAAPGVGAYVLGDPMLQPSPLLTGGGQEKGRRSGTEAVAAIASFGAAAEVARERLASGAAVRLLALRRRLEERLADIGDVMVVAPAAERLPSTVMLAITGMRAETAQIALDLAGFAVSAGSACTSGKVGASHVLEAMQRAGAPIDLSTGAIRVSFGYETVIEDIDAFAEAFRVLLRRSATRQGGSKAA